MVLQSFSLSETLRALQEEIRLQVETASSSDVLEQIRVQYLGKKGKLSEILAGLKDLPTDERKEVGQVANVLKNSVESEIQKKRDVLQAQELNEALLKDSLDSSAPGTFYVPGASHPIRTTIREVVEIFEKAGLVPVYGPEVEYEEYCFDKLNFQQNHAARDMQATFFVRGSSEKPLVLRTHTSPVQVRMLQEVAKNGFSLPIRIQVPGRVYRVDDDATHSPMFHQVEGLAVEKNLSMGDLRAVLDFFFRKYLGEETKIRFRPSFFPFTEPSAEVDVSCVFCHAKGCRVCKFSGWLEVAGSGLVHPEVFRRCGWDPQKVQGWAFGFGVERLAMLKLGIPDLRLFYENRISFLRRKHL